MDFSQHTKRSSVRERSRMVEDTRTSVNRRPTISDAQREATLNVKWASLLFIMRGNGKRETLRNVQHNIRVFKVEDIGLAIDDDHIGSHERKILPGVCFLIFCV